MYFHACPPLGCSSQESRNFRLVPFSLTCQATSSHHREVPSPEKLNPLLPNSAASTKPIISRDVCGPFQPSKHKRSLWPTGPFAPSALALLWLPLAHPSALQASHPCTPLPFPCSAQRHLLRGATCSEVSIWSRSALSLPGALSPSCTQKFSLNVTRILPHLTSTSHQSQAPLLLLSGGAHIHLSYPHFATSQWTLTHDRVCISRSASIQGGPHQLPRSPQVETLTFPHWVGFPVISTCPVRAPVRGRVGRRAHTGLSSV